MNESLAFHTFEHATPKQHEALELAADGFTSKQIALALGIAPRTADQRIDALRLQLGGMARNDLVRLYRSWKEACGRATYDPVPLPNRADKRPETQPQKETELVFSDPMAIDGRANWDRPVIRMRPGFGPSELGTGGKLAAVFAAAMLLLMGFALIVATAQGISALAG